jgi:hypothetical protein
MACTSTQYCRHTHKQREVDSRMYWSVPFWSATTCRNLEQE